MARSIPVKGQPSTRETLIQQTSIRDHFFQVAIIAWLVLVFILYHLQYVALAQTFLHTYAERYAPFLIPILSRVIP